MESILYIIIFIIGCFFGSFFTLAVYRLPRKEDILIKHSYCPNCNHKLGFLDLFPILSYIFLKGKCRYCNSKIRIRYLFLELFSGIVFLLTFISMKLNLFNLNIVYVFMFYIYISVLFIIAGIDKEKIKIQKGPLIFGFIIEFVYIIYICTSNNFINLNVYQYVIYCIILILLLILSIILLKFTRANRYWVDILFLSLYMIIFNGSIVYILTAIITLLTIAFYNITNSKKNLIPVGFFLIVNNILIIIITNFICNFIM